MPKVANMLMMCTWGEKSSASVEVQVVHIISMNCGGAYNRLEPVVIVSAAMSRKTQNVPSGIRMVIYTSARKG
ncbi:hypothetical protein FIBSPDRAFT_381421 [Athelia psychrophila]|uniref:Uncharacterized protein n=1 Tax=Athelia psychrophila TaxID=1759441 RepID=A0A167VAZ0_9AGAM|nr:hypothetical protein FIBSPDRAFT_432693 [Fibularhizoctonia sp. CBS 109695]KZP04818.1 hypothetical protein FIBSPDRAFT_381421 [Fibularhizoctonia sp. CBS 109695]